MEKEISIGAVIYSNKKYLLLYKKAHKHYKEAWDFVKGNIEKGEEEKETIAREIKEETGIKKIRFVNGFREKITYFYTINKKLIFKMVVFYFVKTPERKVKLSEEHHGYKWLGFEDALRTLTFKNAKTILKKADKFLRQ